jgi:hypothetical protein
MYYFRSQEEFLWKTDARENCTILKNGHCIEQIGVTPSIFVRQIIL